MKVEKVVNSSYEIIGYVVIDDDFNEVKIISQFTQFLALKNYSPNTLKSYTYDLKYYFDFLNNIGKYYNMVHPKDMIEFVDWLQSRPRIGERRSQVIRSINRASGLSGSSINRILACVSSFYDWILLTLSDNSFGSPILTVDEQKTFSSDSYYHGLLSFTTKSNTIKSRFLKIKTPKRLPRPLNQKIVDTLIDSMNTSRDKAIIFLALQGGLRIGEILGIKFEDVSFVKREIRIKQRPDNENGSRAKGREERTVQFYEKEALSSLNDYILFERPDSSSDLVFLSSKGKTRGRPLTYQGIYTVFSYHCKKNGLSIGKYGSGISLHSFRHTHATYLHENGMSLSSLQKRLGHASIDSTQVYTKISNHNLKEEYSRAINFKSTIS